MRHPEERAVLSQSDPIALWRLARWLGLEQPERHCTPCLRALIEWLAREMVTTR
jgi:hypothetical protein